MNITEDAPIDVTVYRSRIDGALVVEIDTTPDTGKVRVDLNDNPIWDGDPEEGIADDPRVRGNAIMATLADALNDRGNTGAAEWVRDHAHQDWLYEYVGKLLDQFERFHRDDKPDPE